MSRTFRDARTVVTLALATAFAALAAVQTAGASGQHAAASTPLRIVALGDSDTSGSGDPTHVGWVGRYARLLRQRLGLRVTVRNLARNGQTSTQLLAAVRSDPATETTIRQADVVLLGIGGGDLNAGDDRWQAGKCDGRACYAGDLKAFGGNFEATVRVVRKLRGSEKTVLRAITLPNALTGAEDVIPPFLKPVATTIGVYQADTLRREICASMSRHAGSCIDVLHAFNGPDGTENAYTKGLMNHSDCCYPSGKGQQLIAQLLFNTGLKPIR
jgi:lysophospholipase L1-like esterase